MSKVSIQIEIPEELAGTEREGNSSKEYRSTRSSRQC
jgi:hypothetical protein